MERDVSATKLIQGCCACSCNCELVIASSLALSNCDPFPSEACPDYAGPSTVAGKYGSTLADVLMCDHYYLVFDQVAAIHASSAPTPYNPLAYNYAVDGPYDANAYPDLTQKFINVIRFADYWLDHPSIPKRWRLDGAMTYPGYPPGSPIGRDGIGNWQLIKSWAARAGPRVGHNPNIGNHTGSGGVFWHLNEVRLYMVTPLWYATDAPHPTSEASTPPNLAVFPSISGHFLFAGWEWNGTEWEMFSFPDIGADTAYGSAMVVGFAEAASVPDVDLPAFYLVPKGPYPDESSTTDSLFPYNSKPPLCPSYGCSDDTAPMLVGPAYYDERTILTPGKNLGSAIDETVTPQWGIDIGAGSSYGDSAKRVGWLDVRAHLEDACHE